MDTNKVLEKMRMLKLQETIKIIENRIVNQADKREFEQALLENKCVNVKYMGKAEFEGKWQDIYKIFEQYQKDVNGQNKIVEIEKYVTEDLEYIAGDNKQDGYPQIFLSEKYVNESDLLKQIQNFDEKGILDLNDLENERVENIASELNIDSKDIQSIDEIDLEQLINDRYSKLKNEKESTEELLHKSKLLSIPFTFNNRAHFWNFANSDLAPEFLNEPQELGLPVRGLFYGEEGFRHFFTVKPVATIDDLKGMKLRVSNDPVMNGMVEGLGANPTVVAFGELYSALQTGVVDGAEQPIANYKSNAFPEVANNLILDGHTLGAVQAVITDNAWGKLTANQQAAVMAAAADTQKFNADLSETAENKVLEELRSSGCNVVDVDDKTPWQEACAKVIKDNTSDQAELYQKLLDMKA